MCQIARPSKDQLTTWSSLPGVSVSLPGSPTHPDAPTESGLRFLPWAMCLGIQVPCTPSKLRRRSSGPSQPRRKAQESSSDRCSQSREEMWVQKCKPYFLSGWAKTVRTACLPMFATNVLNALRLKSGNSGSEEERTLDRRAFFSRGSDLSSEVRGVAPTPIQVFYHHSAFFGHCLRRATLVLIGDKPFRKLSFGCSSRNCKYIDLPKC